MENNRRTVEINGIKLDVDLSTATRIDEFKVGDNIKVLQKSYSGYVVKAGVIVEFVNFKELPTMVIACFNNDYSVGLDFIYYNSQTEGVEIALCCEHELKLEKNTVLDKFNTEIEKRKHEIAEYEAKRDYFCKYFKKFFEDGGKDNV